MDHLKLGASIYVPAARDDVTDVAQSKKLAHARSVIFCTEDSVSEEDVPMALRNLQNMLNTNPRNEERLLFIRPRNVQVFRQILAMHNIEQIHGFVLPKITARSLSEYLDAVRLAGKNLADFQLMPTLETTEVFEIPAMMELCQLMRQPEIRPSILSLRIGGNDLLNLLGIRRSRHRTIYESPLGPTIANLVTLFKPHGFNLTSPVCEFLYDNEILERELIADAEYGLFGKTAIHPDQISIIENAYRPSEQDVQMAEAILAPGAKAVFNMCGTMCEVATHSKWATQILGRRDVYGVFGGQPTERLRRVA